MRKGRYIRRRTASRMLTTVLALVLVVGLSVGGTLAWLTDKTDDVTNTFTVSDINIDLTETTTEYKMVPGCDIDKDPIVTVEAVSEASWLFVKVTESENFDAFMTYEIADGWTAVPDHDGYYYRQVDAVPEGATEPKFPVLKGNKVHVKEEVTKVQMNALTEATYPKLTFKAAAIQQAAIETVTEAWDNLPTEFKS